MGSNPSKQSGEAPPHVWKGPGPARLSQGMVEQLQSSAENDTTRAQTAELQIQARVAEELKRIQASEAAKLKDAQEKLSAAAKEPPKDGEKDLSRQSVAKEVEALRKRLDGRKQVRELPESVEGARAEVVRCLREHDRRPLDCWREVEAFKEEVRKLEKGWVDRVVS